MKTSHTRAFVFFLLFLFVQTEGIAQSNNWRTIFDTIGKKYAQVDWIFHTIYTENKYKDAQPEILKLGFQIAEATKVDSNTAKLYLSKAKYEQREHNMEAAWANCQKAKLL